MPELPIIMINDFLDEDIRGIFTTQYIEKDEMLLKHNKSGAKIRFTKNATHLSTHLFSLMHGWVELRIDALPSEANLSPLLIPSSDEIDEAERWEVTVSEYRKYNGLRYLKNLAILLGEKPDEMDAIGLELE